MSENLEQYVDNLYRFALSTTGDRHIAEDLTQETFVRAIKSYARASPTNPKAWLFTILLNLVRDRARQNKHSPDELRDDEVSTRFVSPERQAILSEQQTHVLAWMDELPDRQRRVLHLRTVEQFSIQEIGCLLDISDNSVKANLSIARKKMRERMRDEALSFKLK